MPSVIDRPILFSAPMVRAILDGSKTMTRRVMKPQPQPIPDGTPRVNPYDESGYWWVCAKVQSAVSMHDAPCLCPYGYVGDRLYVKETFGTTKGNGIRTVYRADGEPPRGLDGNSIFGTMKWRPSIFMKRADSRITLEITEVRAERLQSITREDALAEGVFEHESGGPPWNRGWSHKTQDDPTLSSLDINGPIGAYATLWNQINGKRPGCSWAESPWVWVVSFTRVEQKAGMA